MKKKIISLILILLLVFSLFGCQKEVNPTESIPISLPNITVEQQAEEIIYINMLENGVVASMQSSNELDNTTFAYYKQYGKFLQEGCMNITNGLGNILIAGDHALVPSLTDNYKFNYILALDSLYYQNKLPFKIEFDYRLDGYRTGYQSLKGANGIIDINIKVTPNKDADPYFKENFAAQIQVPLDTHIVEVLEAKGAMSEMKVGKTLNLIYMVLPNQTGNFNIKLRSNNFKFDGIEGTFSKFNMGDMFGSVINLDSLGLDQLPLLGMGLSIILNEIDGNDELSSAVEMFDSLEDIEEKLGYLDELERLDTLFLALPLLKPLLKGPALSVKPNQPYTNELILKYNNYETSIIKSVDELTRIYNEMKGKIDELVPMINRLSKYPDIFKNFTNIIDYIREMETLLNEVNNLGKLDLDIISDHKQMVSNNFDRIAKLNDLIKEAFQNLIIGMSSFANDLEPLAHSSDLIISLVNNIEEFLVETIILRDILTNYAVDLETDNANKRFNVFAEYPIEALIQALTTGFVVPGMPLIPPIIDLLDLVIDELESIDFSGIEQIGELEKAYIEVNGQRPIDELHLGIILINQNLTIKQPGMAYSFYDGLGMLGMFPTILNLIPEKSENINPVSFLSLNNLTPKYTQFVIKQRGF